MGGGRLHVWENPAYILAKRCDGSLFDLGGDGEGAIAAVVAAAAADGLPVYVRSDDRCDRGVCKDGADVHPRAEMFELPWRDHGPDGARNESRDGGGIAGKM